MKSRIESRSSTVDTEKCVQLGGTGRYDLVLLASQRLRELKRRARENNKHVTAIDALLEVQSGSIQLSDYIAKIK